jgi:hypothetical protein
MRARPPKGIHDQCRVGADEAMVEYFEIALLSARSCTPMFLSGAASLRTSLTTRTPKTRQTSPSCCPIWGGIPTVQEGVHQQTCWLLMCSFSRHRSSALTPSTVFSRSIKRMALQILTRKCDLTSQFLGSSMSSASI